MTKFQEFVLNNCCDYKDLLFFLYERERGGEGREREYQYNLYNQMGSK